MATPYLKNKGPLLVDKVRGWFDQLPAWFKSQVTIRVEKQKVDAKIEDLDPTALESELTQEITDEKLSKDKFLGDGAVGSGNDFSDLPTSNPSKVVIDTGQVADKTETVSASQIPLVEGPPLQEGSSEQVGDVWVTKTVTAPTFDDKVYQLTRQDLIPPEFKALVPEKLEAHTVNGTAALPTLGSGELVRKEEQKKVGVKTVSVQSRDMSSTPVLVGQKVDPQWNGAVLNLEQKIVPASTTLTQAFGTTDASIRPIDGTNALQETWKVTAAGFPMTSETVYDENLQWAFLRQRSIVPTATGYSMDPLDLDQEDKAIDSKHVIRRIDKLNSIPATFSTYTTQMITFPAVLSYLSFALVALAAANRKEPQWTAGIRAAFTAPTNIRNQTDFFTATPTLWPLYTWAPTDIMFKGLSYSLNLSNVLTDTWSNIGVTYAGDTYYGNTVDRFSISATNPSASSYVTGIGAEVAIACVVDVYKGIWVRKTSFVTLR